MGNTCFKGRVGIANRKIYLLMVGLDNAGKTCTAKSIVGDTLDNIAPTVGFSKVDHKYKGYHVTIYDLGGSKSFRGIWHKYYHEVHGFIFVVDSSDVSRLAECKTVLQEMLRNEFVHGKPILLLCNKSDIDQAQDEVELVSKLDVEALVNTAKCPTRVEASIASKGHGLKDGYKWLCKSVIANYLELGSRVERDIEVEKEKEEIRREEVRKRIEERKKKETPNQQSLEDDESAPPGFVPVHELRKKWAEEARAARPGGSRSNSRQEVQSSSSRPASGVSVIDSKHQTQVETHAIVHSRPGSQPAQLRVEDLPSLNSMELMSNGHADLNGHGPLLNGHAAQPNGHAGAKLELEPIHRPKKKGILSKLQRNSEVRSIDSQVSDSPRTGNAFRNWGLAEELTPSG